MSVISCQFFRPVWKSGRGTKGPYSAYESGKIEPSVEKFEELLSGIVSKEKKSQEQVILKVAVGG